MKKVFFILCLCICLSAPARAAETMATPASAAGASAPTKPDQTTAKPDDDLAVLTAKAEKGDAAAAEALANRYAQGKGVSQDETAAVKWWRKAAEGGNTDAQRQLAQEFYDGTPVFKKDYKEACKWFGESAKQDIIASEFYLGLCDTDGLGLTKNHVEAYFWLLVAKKHGYMVSMVLLNKASDDLTPAEKDTVKERVRKWFVAHPLQE